MYHLFGQFDNERTQSLHFETFVTQIHFIAGQGVNTYGVVLTEDLRISLRRDATCLFGCVGEDKASFSL